MILPSVNAIVCGSGMSIVSSNLCHKLCALWENSSDSDNRAYSASFIRFFEFLLQHLVVLYEKHVRKQSRKHTLNNGEHSWFPEKFRSEGILAFEPVSKRFFIFTKQICLQSVIQLNSLGSRIWRSEWNTILNFWNCANILI